MLVSLYFIRPIFLFFALLSFYSVLVCKLLSGRYMLDPAYISCLEGTSLSGGYKLDLAYISCLEGTS